MLNLAALALPCLNQTLTVDVVPNWVGLQALNVTHRAVLLLEFSNLGAQQLPLRKPGLLWGSDFAIQIGQFLNHDGFGLRLCWIGLDVVHPLGHALQSQTGPPRWQRAAVDMP